MRLLLQIQFLLQGESFAGQMQPHIEVPITQQELRQTSDEEATRETAEGTISQAGRRRQAHVPGYYASMANASRQL